MEADWPLRQDFDGAQLEFLQERLRRQLAKAKGSVEEIVLLKNWKELLREGLEDFEGIVDEEWNWDQRDVVDMESYLNYLGEASRRLHYTGNMNRDGDIKFTNFLLQCRLEMKMHLEEYTNDILEMLEKQDEFEASEFAQALAQRWSPLAKNIKTRPDKSLVLHLLKQQMETVTQRLANMLVENTVRTAAEDLIACLKSNESKFDTDPDLVMVKHRHAFHKFDKVIMEAVELLDSKIYPEHLDFEMRRGSLLGHGGFGAVYRGDWNGQAVAVKTVKPMKSEEDKLYARKMLHREAEVWKDLTHSNIVQLFGSCVKEEWFCLVMELCDHSLKDEIHGSTKVNFLEPREFQRSEILHMLLDIFQGVAFLHQQSIMHRDIKPGNILVKRETMKLTDFGLAVFVDQTAGSTRGAMTFFEHSGTFRYMPGEALVWPAKWLFRGDIYMVSMVMFEMINGVRPFEQYQKFVRNQAFLADKQNGVPPTMHYSDEDLQQRVGQDILDFMRLCWNKDPYARPSAQECVEKVKEMMKS